MKILTIYGKLKSSIDDFKKSLSQLINYQPSLHSSDNSFKCTIVIDSIENYDTIDVIRVLVEYCSDFKMEVEENNFFERNYICYTWDGKNLKRSFSGYFDSSCENVNFLLD